MHAENKSIHVYKCTLIFKMWKKPKSAGGKGISCFVFLLKHLPIQQALHLPAADVALY